MFCFFNKRVSPNLFPSVSGLEFLNSRFRLEHFCPWHCFVINTCISQLAFITTDGGVRGTNKHQGKRTAASRQDRYLFDKRKCHAATIQSCLKPCNNTKLTIAYKI